MSKLIAKSALVINFSLPAMLLNSIGVIILMLHNQQSIPLTHMGWLQPFKDGSILIGSIVLLSFIARYGYKLAIQVGCVIEIITCLLMATFPDLYTAYLFFVLAGIAFALLKLSIYSSVSFLSASKEEHAGVISLLEGSFMIAIFIGNGLFAWMIAIDCWSAAFYFFSLFGIIALASTYFLEFKHTKPQTRSGFDDYKRILQLIKMPAVLLFLVFALSYPFIEQGFIDFLPTFQSSVLSLSHSKSVLIAALLPAMIALGRILFTLVLKKIALTTALYTSVILAIVTMSTALVCAHYAQSFSLAGLVAVFMLPMVGLFIAPIYPALNSSILSAQKASDQSSMTLIIMIFSAIGASVGSVSTGYVFNYFGGIHAFSLYIVVLIVILLLLIPYFIITKVNKDNI